MPVSRPLAPAASVRPWDTVLAALALFALVAAHRVVAPSWPTPPDTPAHRLAQAQAQVAGLRVDYLYPTLARVGPDSAVAVVRQGETLQRWFQLARLAHPAPDLVAALQPVLAAEVGDDAAVRLLSGSASTRRARLTHFARLVAEGRPASSALEAVFARQP